MVAYGIPDQHQQTASHAERSSKSLHSTGCTHDTNIQHLHDETNILPIQKHLQLHASQIRQKAQYPSHPLYKYTTHKNSQRLMKPTTFNNSRYTTTIPTDPCTVTTADIKANMRDIHTTIVSQHLAARDNNKILRTHQGWGQVQLTKYSSTPSTPNIYQVQVLVKYSFFKKVLKYFHIKYKYKYKYSY